MPSWLVRVFCCALAGGACTADVAAQAPFTDEAEARGIDYTPTGLIDFGRGLAFVDLDDDGDPDVVAVGNAAGDVGIWENDGTGHFIDRADASLSGVIYGSGVTAADYDRDGDLDVHVACYGSADLFLRNDGGFAFSDVTGEAAVAVEDDGVGCAWGDFDGDGWIDLYTSNRNQPNRLFRNLGDGTFEDVGVTLGVDRGEDWTFQSSFFDFDRDGDADLYVANDKGQFCTTQSNHLFENLGDGTFEEITIQSNTQACVLAMCIAIGDFDGNGWQDLYCTNIAQGNALMMNDGDGWFDREEVDAGVGAYVVGWGAVFCDFDNDRHQDLFVCNQAAPNHCYRHDGDWPCDDVAAGWHLDERGHTYCCAVADIDDDGDLDMLVQFRDEPLRLYINHADEDRHWLKLDVVGEGPNRWAIGANVDVESGGGWQLREVIAGCNYKAQNELTLHYGLGDADVADRVEAMWPGGTTRTVTNVPADATWRLYPPDKLGDGDGDGDRDSLDLVQLFVCFTGDEPGALDSGCEAMDLDGDWDVDVLDLLLLLERWGG